MKKFVRQGLSLLLALSMVLSFVPMSVASAAVGEKAIITIENSTIDITGVSAGETKRIVVPVKIDQNVGFAAMDLTFSLPKGWSISAFPKAYDGIRDIFQKYDNDLGDWDTDAQYMPNPANGKWLVAAPTDHDQNGYLCWISVQVPGGIANGEYPITVSMTSSKKAADSATNINDQFVLVDGTITVTGGVDLSVDVTTETTEYTYPAGTVSPLTAEVKGADSDTYQWYMQGSDATEATAIEGATSATYTPELTTFGTTTYYCVATVQEMELESNKIAITYNQAQLPEIKLDTTTTYTYNTELQGPPEYTVETADGTKLVKGTDYEETPSLTAQKNADEYEIKLTGKGNYTGTQTTTWTIKSVPLTLTDTEVPVLKGGDPASLPKAQLLQNESADYDANNLTYKYSISGSTDIKLDEKDGTVSALATAAEGATATVSITITDKNGNYVQEKPETVTVTVSSKDNVSDKLTFTAKDGSQAATTTYTESGIKLSDLVNEATFGGTANGTGKISYSYKRADDTKPNSIDKLDDLLVLNAGTYTITATYEDDSQMGSQSVTLTVTPMSITVEVTVDPEPLPFNNEAQIPKVTVTASNKELVLNTDYTVEAKDNINVGEKTLTVSPMGNYTFTPVTKEFTIVKGAAPEIADATEKYVYDTTGVQSTTIGIRANAQITDVTVGDLVDTAGIISGVPTAKWETVDGIDSVIVSYNLAGKDSFVEGMTATIPLTIVMNNYENVEVSVFINLEDEKIRIPVVSANDIEVTYSGIPLTNSYISGTATCEGEVVEGSWEWVTEAETLVNAGTHYPARVLFVPKDTTRYASEEDQITVRVNKATPSVEVKYDNLSSTNRTLADAHLSVGSSSTPGSVAWDLPTTTTARSGVAYKWTFTPYDTANYNSVTGQAILYTGSDSDTSYPVIIGGGGGTTTTQRPNGGTPNNTGDGGNPDPTPSASPSPTPTPTPEPVVINPEVTVSNGTATANVSSADIQDAIKNLSSSKNDGIVIEPAVTGSVSKTEVSLPADAVNAIANNTKSALTVKTPQANFTVSNSGLAQLGKQGSSIVLSAEQLTDRSGTGVDLQVKTGSTLVENVTGGIQLEIPTKCGPGYAAVLVNDAGEVLGVVRKGYANDAGTSMNVPLAGSAKVVVTENAKTFDDVAEKDWSFDAIAFASSHELMRGIDDSHFAPDAQMTRAMLAVVLHNLENNPDAAQAANFSDVANDTWYTQAIQWAADKGIVKGYDSGAFGIDDPITREQIIVMLYRYAGSPKSTGNALNKFSDADRISDWAQDAMLWAVSNEILNGTDAGELVPQGTAARDQVAQILMNFVCSGLA